MTSQKWCFQNGEVHFHSPMDQKVPANIYVGICGIMARNAYNSYTIYNI